MLPDDLIPSTTSPPYSLPLPIERFEAALRTGHGRAWQHAVNCGVADRLDAVVYACMHCLAYDAQCEGNRAEWMLALIDAAGVTDVVTPMLLESAAQPPDEDEGFWHAVQRCRVMLELAKRGEDAARALLYQSFRPNGETMDLIGCAEILELDGADGLIFVCQKLGQWIAEDASRQVDDQPLWKFDERAQPGVAARLLDPCGGTIRTSRATSTRSRHNRIPTRRRRIPIWSPEPCGRAPAVSTGTSLRPFDSTTPLLTKGCRPSSRGLLPTSSNGCRPRRMRRLAAGCVRGGGERLRKM